MEKELGDASLGLIIWQIIVIGVPLLIIGIIAYYVLKYFKKKEQGR